MLYIARNYNMGRIVKEAKFEADNAESAMRRAEQLVPRANGQGQAGRKATIIGVRAA